MPQCVLCSGQKKLGAEKQGQAVLSLTWRFQREIEIWTGATVMGYLICEGGGISAGHRR